MTRKLSEIERLRLDKLVWLYCLEAGDEGPCSANGSDFPTAIELTSTLAFQDVDVDLETIEAIISGKQGISDELAARVEIGFSMPAGWLSQP